MGLSSLVSSNAELTSVPKIAGEWFRIQWMPDLSTGELLNIGVVFKETGGRVHVKMLNQFTRLTCLYDVEISESAAFVISVVESSLLAESNVSPSKNVIYSDSLFVQGSDSSKILNELFDTSVTLSRPVDIKKEGSIDRIKTISTAELREVVFHQVRAEIGVLSANQILPQCSILTKKYGDNVYQLDIPVQGKGMLGSVVSAAHKTVQHVELNLLRAFSDVETAVRVYEGRDKGGMFVLKPEDKVIKTFGRKNRYEIEKKLDNISWKAESNGIIMVVRDDPKRLADDLIKWAS